MAIIIIAIISMIFSLSLFPIFPWNLGIMISCLIGCGYWWYGIYDRAQSVYRDWKVAKANVKILEQKRKTILLEVLQIIDKYSDWNMKALEQASDSTPSVWWLQERYPNSLDTMDNSRYYISTLEEIETQINNQKMIVTKLAGYVRMMKMDQFFGACVPNYIIIEIETDIISNSLIEE